MAKTRKTKKTSKKTTRITATAGDTCFAIMPFGGWFDDYYSTIFVPAIEQAGLTACRADDLYRPSTIVADIWNYTSKAKLVIADLSGKNPNVFYELGLAHALAKPAILVVESMDDIPFDLRALRVLQYDKNDPNWGSILQDKIVKAISEVLADPVLSVPTAFIETKPQRGIPAVTENEKELLSIRQDLDLLRREVRVGGRRSDNIINGPDEAREEIERMLQRGYPKSHIRRQLLNRDVPQDWIEEELDKMMPIQKKRRLASSMDEVSDKDDTKLRDTSRKTVAKGKKEAVARSKVSKRKVTKKKLARKKTIKRKA